MQLSPRAKRISLEISQLFVPKFGRDNLSWDSVTFNWVMIERFTLPLGWINKRPDSPLYNRRETPLLIEIPPGYPDVAPQNFYAEQHLQSGTEFISHYFDKPGTGIPTANRFTHKGWAWLCIHVNSWENKTNFTKGDNLITITRLIYDIMSDKRNARRNYYT